MSADFSQLAAHLEAGLVAHADRDRLTGIHRAIFLDRGGHAPGEHCMYAEMYQDPRDANPNWPYDDEERPL